MARAFWQLTEDVPGAEALAPGPGVRVERPDDAVGGRVGGAEEEARGEQAADGEAPCRRTAPSLSHGGRRLLRWCFFLALAAGLRRR